MDDLISRQAAINALHDEIVRRRIDEDSNDDGALDEFDTEDILRKWPPAQPEVLSCGEGELSAQPEIIRCKGCKHQVKEWREDKRLNDKGYLVCGCEVVGDACGFWALLGQDDDYCSYAERRTDE